MVIPRVSCGRVLGFLAVLWAAALIPALALAQAEAPVPLVDKDVHMGVATCAGSTCHGAIESIPGVFILQNEYVTWQRHDKHAKAYQVLLNDRSKRIAANLGLEAAHKAKICLDCHADNPPQKRRHRTFQLTDGVTCESCHGGAGRWIGTHIAADATHKRNVANGLFPTADPVQRARLCLSCHFGDENRFVTHRIMGAGHPRMSFELDTFTAIQPAHFKVDADYRQRKGNWNGVQTWAIGQAMAMGILLDALIDPKRGRDGIFPEFVIFDCYTCHHRMSELRWAPRPGAEPGVPRINDANLLMLRIVTAHLDPALGKEMAAATRALHQATGEGFEAMIAAAKGMKALTTRLVKTFSGRQFAKGDVTALLDGVVAAGLDGAYLDYPGAEQATMALGTILNALRDMGAVDKQRHDAMKSALDGIYKAVEKDEQGDEIVRLRPADYKDHFPAPNAQLQSDPNQLASPQVQPGAGPSPQGNREPAGTRNPIQLPVTSRNPLAIPGVDPLFFETLSPHSLQNLADSHQIHNEIVSQANRLGRAPGPDGSTNLAARLGNAVNFLRTQPPHVREGIVRGLERQLAGGAYP